MPTSLYRSSQRLIFSYPNSAPLGYTDGAILTDETGGKVLIKPSFVLGLFFNIVLLTGLACMFALFLVAQKHQENTFLKQCLYKYRVPIELRTGVPAAC